MRSYAVALAAALVWCAQAGAQETPDTSEVALDTVPLTAETTLTLDAAIAGAMQTSPVAAQATAGVRVTSSAERVAIGEYLPTAQVSASWYHAGTPSLGQSATGVSLNNLGTADPVTRPTPALTAGGTTFASSSALSGPLLQQVAPSLSTSATTPYSNAYAIVAAGWDVFTAGRRPADNAWARALTRAARSTEVEDRFFVIGTVKTAFYNVMRDEDLETVAQAQLRRAGEDLRAAQHRHLVGASTPADVLQFELNLNAARQALLQAITNRRSDAYTLGRLAGIAGAAESDRANAPLAPSPLALSDSAIVALAVTAAPTLVAALDSERAANAAMWAARTQYLPTIRLGGAIRRSKPASLGARSSRVGRCSSGLCSPSSTASCGRTPSSGPRPRAWLPV